MAKILDKLLPPTASRAVKLRQRYDWLKTESEFLPDKFEAKKEKEKNKFIYKANKKLSSAAYLVCDKVEYADSVMAEKLQKFDISNYMSHRAANHKAAKAIFKAIKSGSDWSFALAELKQDNKNICDKRNARVAKLLAERNKFILDYKESLDRDAAKIIMKELLDENKNGGYFKRMKKIDHDLSMKKPAYVAKLRARRNYLVAKAIKDNNDAYNALSKSLEKEYNNFSRNIGAKYAAVVDAKQKKLGEKMASVNESIDYVKSRQKAKHSLPDDVLLSVRGLKMYFGGLKAVDDLSFDVKKGEIFGLIGPNGAGKTTVFNCITRFYDATGGDMYFENKYGEVVDLRKYKVHDIILQGISRTFQNIELVKEISVIENLLVAGTRSYQSGFVIHALGLPMLRKEEKMMREKAMRILKFMELENYAHWLAFGLPYGILKKVEIARALMADAKLIIMDEPAAGLNDSETAELTKTIRRIRDEFGVTILLVEHDMGLVMNVCDTVCAISFGQMLAIGTTEEIQKNKAVQEAYLGVEEDE